MEILSQAAQTSPFCLVTALGTTEKTIKVHRGWIVEKTRARSMAELVRLARKSGRPLRKELALLDQSPIDNTLSPL